MLAKCSVYEQPFASRCFVGSDSIDAAAVAIEAQGWMPFEAMGDEWDEPIESSAAKAVAGGGAGTDVADPGDGDPAIV